MSQNAERFLLTVDLAGTILFAVEGAAVAINGQLDFFGVLVLSFATALAGGIMRDLLIGAVPPRAIADWRYAAAAFIAGALTFGFYGVVREIPAQVIIVLDAAALGLFAVAGTEKALLYRVHPFIAILLGTITAVGGGTVSAIFLAQIPPVLRVDIYATAALVGSAVMVAGRLAKLPALPASILGGAVCVALRVVSVWQHWQLPHAVAS